MKPSPLVRRSAAFTLVELLVVITIIVILAGLLLAAIPAAINATRRAEAKQACHAIVNGVTQYANDYGKFPPVVNPAGSAPGAVRDIVVGDPASGATMPNNVLMFTLRGIPGGPNTGHAANPNKTAYLETKVARVNGAGVVRSGFFDRTASGSTPPADQESCFYDPWGRQYGVAVDADGDGRIDLTDFYSDFAGTQPSVGHGPRVKVGAFSLGRDEKPGTNGDRVFRKSTSEVSDDLVSWD